MQIVYGQAQLYRVNPPTRFGQVFCVKELYTKIII